MRRRFRRDAKLWLTGGQEFTEARKDQAETDVLGVIHKKSGRTGSSRFI